MKRFLITETKATNFRGGNVQHSESPDFSVPTSTINMSSGGQVSSTLNAGRHMIQLVLKLRFRSCSPGKTARLPVGVRFRAVSESSNRKEMSVLTEEHSSRRALRRFSSAAQNDTASGWA